MKICKDCQTEMPVSDFYKSTITKDGYNSYCKKCHQARIKSSPNQEANIRKAQLKKLYDITPEEYDKLLEKQEGVCAICLQPNFSKKGYLSVDHDHNTGFVRGLLCRSCNMGIGKLKDDTKILKSAIFYLDKANVEMNRELREMLIANMRKNGEWK